MRKDNIPSLRHSVSGLEIECGKMYHYLGELESALEVISNLSSEQNAEILSRLDFTQIQDALQTAKDVYQNTEFVPVPGPAPIIPLEE